jgi:hypothetical protein
VRPTRRWGCRGSIWRKWTNEHPLGPSSKPLDFCIILTRPESLIFTLQCDVGVGAGQNAAAPVPSTSSTVGSYGVRTPTAGGNAEE